MAGTFLEEELEKKEEVVEAGCASDSEEEDEDADFEFAFVCRDPDTTEITADELFFNGQIRPAFPILNRELAAPRAGGGDARASSTSGGDACDSIMLPMRKLLIEDRGAGGAPADGEYCLWTPRSPAVPASPGQCKKSRSTGSTSRRWRLRDLIHRSSSDGKDAFVFLSAAVAPATATTEKGKGKSGNSSDGSTKKKAGRPISAHEIYLRNRAVKEAHGPSYALPYRPGLMGFFSNA